MGTQKSTNFFYEKKKKKMLIVLWQGLNKGKKEKNNKKGKNGNELLLEGKSLKTNGWLIHGGNRQRMMVRSLG
jgi:hypothetical protein